MNIPNSTVHSGQLVVISPLNVFPDWTNPSPHPPGGKGVQLGGQGDQYELVYTSAFLTMWDVQRSGGWCAQVRVCAEWNKRLPWDWSKPPSIHHLQKTAFGRAWGLPQECVGSSENGNWLSLLGEKYFFLVKGKLRCHSAAVLICMKRIKNLK